MTVDEAVAELDAITDEPEEAHLKADDVLLRMVDPRVKAAYKELVKRTEAWWYA